MLLLRAMFPLARGSLLRNQHHPPAMPDLLQALGRLWLISVLQEEGGREQDLSHLTAEAQAQAAALHPIRGEEHHQGP